MSVMKLSDLTLHIRRGIMQRLRTSDKDPAGYVGQNGACGQDD